MKKTILITGLIISMAIISYLPRNAASKLNLSRIDVSSNKIIYTGGGGDMLPSVPNYVKPGDLYFCECHMDLEPSWDHVGIYTGNYEFI